MTDRLAILESLLQILPKRPVTEPDEFNRLYLKLSASKLCNLISPVSSIDYVPQMHAISLRTVLLDIEDDCYQDRKFCRDDERALSQTGILKLWRNAGGRDVACERIDDRMDPLVAEFRATVALQGPDGREVETMKTRVVDLRPGAPDVEGMTERQLPQARRMVVTMADTKAKLRAARAAMGIKQKYTLAELVMPWLIPTLVPVIDTSDPAMARLVGAKALGVVAELFGPQAQARHRALHEPEPQREAINVTTDGEVIDADPVTDDPFDDEAPAPSRLDRQCTCPCGCTTLLLVDQSEKSHAALRTDRCRECWPSAKRFDTPKHAALQDSCDLQIPNRPGLTAGKLRGIAAQGGA